MLCACARMCNGKEDAQIAQSCGVDYMCMCDAAYMHVAAGAAKERNVRKIAAKGRIPADLSFAEHHHHLV